MNKLPVGIVTPNAHMSGKCDLFLFVGLALEGQGDLAAPETGC